MRCHNSLFQVYFKTKSLENGMTHSAKTFRNKRILRTSMLTQEWKKRVVQSGRVGGGRLKRKCTYQDDNRLRTEYCLQSSADLIQNILKETFKSSSLSSLPAPSVHVIN